MRLFSIKQAVVTLGAVAALAVGMGMVPGASGTASIAQAAELAQPAAGGGGNGIAGMRERAAALGGRLEAGPRPGGGFRVRSWLPVRGGS
jgi:hypothetical protein